MSVLLVSWPEEQMAEYKFLEDTETTLEEEVNLILDGWRMCNTMQFSTDKKYIVLRKEEP